MFARLFCLHNQKICCLRLKDHYFFMCRMKMDSALSAAA